MILLARHGETDANVPPLRFQGRLDTVLNENGRRQAIALAERMRGERIASLWCSDLTRARETAEVVGRAIGLEPVVDPRYAEGDRGRWEGRLMEDVAREEPDAYAAWRRAGADWRFPGGESLQEHSDRVAAALAELRDGALPALVVCHGGSIRVTLCAGDPRGLGSFHEHEVPNTAVVRL